MLKRKRDCDIKNSRVAGAANFNDCFSLVRYISSEDQSDELANVIYRAHEREFPSIGVAGEVPLYRENDRINVSHLTNHN